MRLGEIYAALGIDDDGDSDDSKDEDYVEGEDDKEDNEDDDTSESEVGDILEADQAAVRMLPNNMKKLVKSAVPEKAFDRNKRLNTYSPHVLGTSSPLKKRKVPVEDKLSQRATSASSAGKPKVSSSPEYIPRQRASKHLEGLELMNVGDEIVNVVSPFAAKDSFLTWKDFKSISRCTSRGNT
ncbi:hypothetical protein DVH05_026857 [Phytophthora capsici]|nr:hypothetical protein DVH05_026857 [Phytophthora capsici]